MPELLVVALHQALFIASGFAFHSSLITFLREQYGTGQTSSYIQAYVYFTLADPAMPISPTHVAAGYPPL